MKDLITKERHRDSSNDVELSLLEETQSDRGRLVYSAPFRRLQQKAQVFSLETNAAVRSRLTHSIEVSHIGRYIVSEILELIKNPENKLEPSIKNYWNDNNLSISNIVETACLMHDIGNPPFGHFGEAAISEWFSSPAVYKILKRVLKTKDTKTKLRKRVNLLDFQKFDGNPQGFRIITKLQGDDEFGINLTYTQLVSYLKYIHEPNTSKNKLHFNKKAGFYSTEKDLVSKAWDSLNMDKNTRHPLSFLMEASDDISYCISDIEDGIEKKIITDIHFFEIVGNGIKELNNSLARKNKPRSISDKLVEKLNGYNEDNKGDKKAISDFVSFKTTISNMIVKYVANEFVDNYNDFLSFNRTKEMIHKESEAYQILEILKNYTSSNLFSSIEAEKMELAGSAIINGLLEEFSKLLDMPAEQFDWLINQNDNKKSKKIRKNKLDIHRRLFNILPKKHLSAYVTSCIASSHKDIEWNSRAHLIVDFISGMTDHFALETYQMLKGIKIV